MIITELIEGLPIELVRGPASTVIRDIVEDSRCAAPGCLFAARAGLSTDGRAHVGDAVARGATAILARDAGQLPDLPETVTALSADDVAHLVGILAERLHGRPGATLKLVGVTGTNGKTTVSHLIHHTLRRAGTRCGLMGTIHVDDGRQVEEADFTTPPATEISRRLAAMVRNGCTAAVMEVSSHALHQGRTAGLGFDVGVFTNLSGDHLDYHGTLGAYGESKAALLRSVPPTGWAVVNVDDPAATRMTDGCRAHVLSCSLTDAGADCRASIRQQSITGIDSRFSGPWGDFDVHLPLAGRHNVANALEAAAACFALGIGRSALQDALSRCAAPRGRLEPVTEPGDPVTVLVDYAHTDDALANVLRTLRPLVPEGASLRVVFGCGGDRDRTKRPRMGRVAAQLADELYVTSDNPRTEDPQTIIDEITRGIPGLRWPDTVMLVDRKLAIEAAIDRTRPGDVVLIAGKGHEPYQIIGTEKRPFDDRRTAAEALAHHRTVATA
ncbi:MAG: UDP-N-acetylmuramoyl-L-alanyl-D-glutamate--2,6-diaminopimelate ligase [Planctomycetota bacterium]